MDHQFFHKRINLGSTGQGLKLHRFHVLFSTFPMGVYNDQLIWDLYPSK